MIKVIEHGYKRYTHLCHNCKCKFLYELEDIKDGYIECPDCKVKCIHNSSNWSCGSQIKEQDNEAIND